MKYVKTLGLAAVAAMVLMAVGTGSASATTLYSGATPLPAGTVIVATLTGSGEWLETPGTRVNTCTASTISMKTNQGSAAVISGQATLAWSSCTATTDTLKSGTLTIQWTSGRNGTVISDNAEFTMMFGPVSCVYGSAATGTTLGTLFGRETEDATVEINNPVEFKSGSFLCPTSLVWKAKYKVTSPSPLHVTP